MTLFGVTALGLGLLAIGGWMLWRKKSRKIVTWMWFVAGFCVSGGLAGALAGIFGQVGGGGAHLFSVGFSVFMTVAGIVALLELWHGAHPKKGEPKVHHPVLGLITPLILGLGALHAVVGAISAGLGHLPLTQIFGG